MLPNYQDFKNLSDSQSIEMARSQFNNSIKKITFMQIDKDFIFSDKIKSKIYDSTFFIFDSCVYFQIRYFMACFNDHFIIFDENNQTFISNFFDIITKKDNIFFLSNSSDFFNNKYHFKCQEKETSILQEEIESFIDTKKFKLSPKFKHLNEFWKLIQKCLSGYLIEKSYFKCKKDRFYDFFTNIQEFF